MCETNPWKMIWYLDKKINDLEAEVQRRANDISRLEKQVQLILNIHATVNAI